jgi:hypothetical protein
MIDFTKPIQHKNEVGTIKVIFHDAIGVYFKWDYNNIRTSMDLDDFQKHFENVPEEPKKIKGFIAVFDDGHSTTIHATKEIIFNTFNRNKIVAIVEINATEGEGLQ